MKTLLPELPLEHERLYLNFLATAISCRDMENVTDGRITNTDHFDIASHDVRIRMNEQGTFEELARNFTGSTLFNQVPKPNTLQTPRYIPAVLR
jgi:hypothetical protein